MEAVRIIFCIILRIAILCATRMECAASYVSELIIFNGLRIFELPVFGSEKINGGSVGDHREGCFLSSSQVA